jgi:glutamyl-tRNA reductase
MIGLLGISHKTASLNIRGQYTFLTEEIQPFYEEVQQATDITDMVVLSTCNRTEIYFSQGKYPPKKAFELILAQVNQFKKLENSHAEYFYRKIDKDVARHLFEVIAGFDSMVIGEDQIIGQVKDAYLSCTKANMTDAVLMRLFQKSFEAGKRVRAETAIKVGATSVSAAAVEICQNMVDNLTGKKVLIIGAGDTAGITLQSLVKKGACHFAVSNRTPGNAERLAKRYNGKVIPFEYYPDHLSLFDIVIVVTSSPTYLIDKKMMEASAEKRNGKPQLLIDLSVPRNIEEQAGTLPDIHLFGVDDLKQNIAGNTEKRLLAVDSARPIIDEVVTEFCNWYTGRSLRPAIKAIKTNLQRVNQEELGGYKKINSEDVQRQVNEYTNHLTQRYARILIKNLKKITDNGRDAESLRIINELFKVNE